AVKDSLHAFNVGTATAADIDRIMRLQSDTVYMESTTMFRGSGTNRREIAGRDRYFSGGRDMKAALDNIVTRTMSTAMEGLPQDLASQKFTSTEEMSRYIEQKTGLPADAVREQLKRDELAAFAKETGKASFSPKDAEGRYADYPVLATIASEARKDQIAADLEKYEAKGNIDVALLDKKKNMLFSNAGGDPENRLLYEDLYHEDYMRTGKYDRDRIAKMNSNIESGAISGKQADGTVASIPREDPLSEAKGNGMARVAKSKAAGIISGVGKSGSGKSGRELRNEAYKALAAGLDGFTREQIVSNFRVDVETMVRSTGEANAEANMSVLKGEVKGGLIKIAKSDFDGTQKAKRIYLSAGTAAMQFDDFVKQYGTEKGYSNGLIRQLQESGGTNEGDVAILRGELSAAHNKAREEVVNDMADDINYNEEAGAKHYRQADWAVGGKAEPMEKYVAGAWNANPSTAATKKIIPILSMDPVRREKTSRDMESG
ncbi:MAG: hypothetical protein KAG97_11605, partial [Victivallales bacterium]|nr:hypothetical protein [Victivallales bacterium]